MIDQGYKKKPLVDRFWGKVEKSDGCWLWTGSLMGGVWYGFIRGDEEHGCKTLLAHRLSWEIHNGRIPNKLHVLHRCDTPRCVRPDHLFLGTQGDNVKDMMAKERSIEGKKLTRIKLVGSEVRAIRILYKSGMSHESLAEEFKCSIDEVKYITSRIVCKMVPA